MPSSCCRHARNSLIKGSSVEQVKRFWQAEPQMAGQKKQVFDVACEARLLLVSTVTTKDCYQIGAGVCRNAGDPRLRSYSIVTAEPSQPRCTLPMQWESHLINVTQDRPRQDSRRIRETSTLPNVATTTSHTRK